MEALREKGARITGTVEFTTLVHAVYPTEMQGPYDIIFLMTKRLHNALEHPIMAMALLCHRHRSILLTFLGDSMNTVARRISPIIGI